LEVGFVLITLLTYIGSGGPAAAASTGAGASSGGDTAPAEEEKKEEKEEEKEESDEDVCCLLYMTNCRWASVCSIKFFVSFGGGVVLIYILDRPVIEGCSGTCLSINFPPLSVPLFREGDLKGLL
jgi:60s Acidic ribosomal protein